MPAMAAVRMHPASACASGTITTAMHRAAASTPRAAAALSLSRGRDLRSTCSLGGQAGRPAGRRLPLVRATSECGGEQEAAAVNPLRVDIVETEEGYTLFADVPGMETKDVDLSLSEGVLTITAERPPPPAEGGRLRRKERASGKFGRQVRVRSDADVAKMEAEVAKGVLTISVPKIYTPPPEVTKIPIKQA